MDNATLKIVFGVILLIALILLIIWSIIVSKSKMSKKRKNKLELSRLEQKESLKEDASGSKGYWYNKEDMTDADEIMKIKYQHHFNDIDECVNSLIIEMYDCGLVKTEELYTTAYGLDALTPDALVFKTSGLSPDDASDENEDNSSEDSSLPPVDDDAQKEIYDKWCSYVDELLKTVEIKASDDDKNMIIDELKTYGRKNLLTLLYSPE